MKKACFALILLAMLTLCAAASAENWVLQDTKAATCITQGYQLFVDQETGESKIIYLDALGHARSGEYICVNEAEANAKPCAVGKIMAERCARYETCGHVFADTEYTQPPEAEHQYTLMKEAMPATCTTIGFKALARCSVCGQADPQRDGSAILPFGHDYTGAAWVLIKMATCASEGEVALRCVNCGMYGERQAIPKTEYHIGRTGEALEISDLPEILAGRPATCTQDGVSALRECPTCGAQYGQETVPALGHDYQLKETLQAASCTQEGRGRYVCARCGVEAVDVIPFAHQWALAEGEGLPFTCTKNGTEVYLCQICGERETREVQAPGHQLEEELYQLAKYDCCEQYGWHCLRCNVMILDPSKTVIISDAHSWETVTEAVAPTCTEPGQKALYKCALCDTVDEADNNGATVAALGHTTENQAWQMAKPSTCTESGTVIKRCARCGEVAENLELALAEHSWSDWALDESSVGEAVNVYNRSCSVCGKAETESRLNDAEHVWMLSDSLAPTCTVNGYNAFTCSDCGLIARIIVPSLGGHSPGEYRLINAEAVETAPCVTPIYARVCERYETCGYVFEDETYSGLAQGSHDYSVVEEEAVAATCTTPGKKSLIRCSFCGQARPGMDGSEIAAKGHSIYGQSWEIALVPTCEQDGRLQRQCINCGMIAETMPSPALGHVWREEKPAIAPTASARGVTALERCARCARSRGRELLPALEQVIALTLPQGMTEVTAESFAACGATEITVPGGVASIGARAFADCPALLFAYLPDSVTDIAADAFQNSPVILLCQSENDAAAFARAQGIEYIIP
ncbi:MAG: leucine-rich repeat protein [Clostridia bacterium]|nr:leucine-rich repeat protein [Clostridia bacterium]